ncbi:MAG: bifunctional (p)ppGpp synthetase/guanosine-3',5'-bis(diphosphate) 3'-pyrophosphohydrolase [Dehalococcoidia bacterium]|nr:MAG: bifunctional (p)ppGpp synthetase/guanosine-3',5'-bis(diphosphate) 3'-pyrophosphohydrolase [Dehalococcoidia bacterium]
MDIRALIDKTQEYLPSETLALIEDAYEFASEAYERKRGKAAEGELGHALQTAILVAELQLDASCIAAALLHELPEKCEVSFSEIKKRFGAETCKLVEGLAKLEKVSLLAPEEVKPKKAIDIETRAESLRRMLMALSEDIRVVFIRLADRLHHMRTLKTLPPSKRRAIAEETMEIYAPVAHRLGILQIKWQLEDLAFRYLEPEQYRHIVRFVAAGREEREKYIAQVTKILKEELGKAGIRAEIRGRPKHIFSINRKMEKYASQGKELSEIYDLLGFRLLVDQVPDCYSALGVIHSLWRPLPDKFDDYIANPREGVYQSLHTTVMCMGTTPLEIQIRTHGMHRVAEYGIAAHWRYEEGARRDAQFEEKLAVLRQLLEWYQELGGAEFVESIKMDIFGDRVYVYTPKGEIKDLPAGSTPLDFAYRIHTDLGHRCIGAKVNRRMVPLSYQLKSGDTVEILATKGEKGPSRDWLNPSLGYIKTSHAREKVRQWFRKQEREENIQRGRELLEKELRRLGISLSEEELADLFKRESVDDFLAAIGYGDISTHKIAPKLAVQQERPFVLPELVPRRPKVSSAVQVMGVGDLLTHLAPCCNPMPGDEIMGYVTRTKGVTVHRKDCPNIVHTDEKERLIKVEWGRTDQFYSVPVRIEAWDRVGLLRDISAIVAEEKVNIASVNATNHDDQTTSIFLSLETKGIEQLSRLLSKLEGVRGIISVTRHM